MPLFSAQWKGTKQPKQKWNGMEIRLSFVKVQPGYGLRLVQRGSYPVEWSGDKIKKTNPVLQGDLSSVKRIGSR